MKVICITDIHGYLETAINILEKLEQETKLDLTNQRKWSGEHILVLNGDMFDRGSDNKKALEWALNQPNTVYNIGNHEFFALFPHAAHEFLSEQYFAESSKQGLYWRDMSEDKRLELLESVADGKITAAYKKYRYSYSHAGLENTSVQEINKKLQEVGKKLLAGYKNQNYQSIQHEIIETVQTKNGAEIKSQYPELFDFRRNKEGKVSKGGVVWRRYDYLENTEQAQVVGHTKGKYMRKRGGRLNPQKRGKTININTIRDHNAGRGSLAVTVEDQEKLDVYTYETEH